MELVSGRSRYLEPGAKKNAHIEAVSSRRFTDVIMGRRGGGTRYERSIKSGSVDGLPNPATG
jgi:hypothetical protein